MSSAELGRHSRATARRASRKRSASSLRSAATASTLLSGVVVLFIGLVLSETVLRSKVPKELRDFLGNGLFLVVAWVGLWYPLDTLFYAGRPHRAERKLLRALGQVELVVHPIGSDAGRVGAADPAVARPVAGQSLTGG